MTFYIGSGGGATGFQNGFTIDSVGNFYSWNGRIMGDNSKFAGIIPKDSLHLINELITSNNLVELNYKSPGNFYSFIKIETNDKNNYIVWNPDEINDTTKLINNVHINILRIVKNVK
jgi:hypothetical protein